MISSLIKKKQSDLPKSRKEYNKVKTRLAVEDITKITLTQFQERLTKTISFSCGELHKKSNSPKLSKDCK